MKINVTLALAVALAVGSPVQAYDLDHDGVEDEFDLCNNTPAGVPVDTEGRPLGDIDKDCDTDLDDFELLQQAYTGPLEPFHKLLIETVSVPKNENLDDPNSGYGGVAYQYNLGLFEVTAGQYARFLNSVAATDTYDLYNESMGSSADGCQIMRSGSAGSYAYEVADDWADRPVNYVSWGDAVRFANWLHNGQPTGAQDLTTTEDGSYFLDGAMSDTALLAVVRDPDATWIVPSENEWYKAAYHHNDGATGNYWDYPTGSDTVPVSETPPGTNATIGSANYFDGVYAIGSPYYRTEVGAYVTKPSVSPYGTFDQGGNVAEWTEAILAQTRVIRGGSYTSINGELLASSRTSDAPTSESAEVGFRLAQIPLVEIETALVGNPGNPDSTYGYGSVAYPYEIGKFEVTVGQYSKFLNAVAATDAHGLYQVSMNIDRSGSDGSYTYTPQSGWENRPVVWMSWGDAARFCNWLHNGQPIGDQDLATTEDGSYFLDGTTGNLGLLAIEREPDATWVLPTENEWYKAAYHYNDGATSNYFFYPTASDTDPGYVRDNGNLKGSGGTPFVEGGIDLGNYATFDGDDGIDGIGPPYYVTQVGEWENSSSPYGTLDQGGNVWEWLETLHVDPGSPLGAFRIARGGSYIFPLDQLRASTAAIEIPTPKTETVEYGFRVGRVGLSP